MTFIILSTDQQHGKAINLTESPVTSVISSTDQQHGKSESKT